MWTDSNSAGVRTSSTRTGVLASSHSRSSAASTRVGCTCFELALVILVLLCRVGTQRRALVSYPSLGTDWVSACGGWSIRLLPAPPAELLLGRGAAPPRQADALDGPRDNGQG